MIYFKEVYPSGCYGVYKINPANKNRLIGIDKTSTGSSIPVRYCENMIPISKTTYYKYTKLLKAWIKGNHTIKLLN